MGPAPTTLDIMLPTTNSVLFNIPRLADDGKNWITYKERLLTAIGARGLMRYIDGRTKQPLAFELDPTGKTIVREDSKPATEAEQEAREEKIDEWYQKDAYVKQHIFSTITDRLLLRVQKLPNASEIWEQIRHIHEGKTELVQVDLRRQLQDTRCEEEADVRNHCSELLRMREELAGMGAILEERDFYAIVLGSLPESYRPLLSSINAAARVTSKLLSPNELIDVVSEEYEHREITSRSTQKKSGNTALSAEAGAKNGRTENRSEGTCFNCGKTGHYRADCWRPGGGKEGQGPSPGQRRGANLQQSCAIAATRDDYQVECAFATSDMVNIAKQLNVPTARRSAIIDSGATSHFSPDYSKFTDYVTISPIEVHTADGGILSAIGRGNIRVDLTLGSARTTVTLKNVLHTLDMVFTLISTNRIAAAGFAVHFEEGTCKILTPAPARRIIADIPQIDGLYSLAAQTPAQAPPQIHSARPRNHS